MEINYTHVLKYYNTFEVFPVFATLYCSTFQGEKFLHFASITLTTNKLWCIVIDQTNNI